MDQIDSSTDHVDDENANNQSGNDELDDISYEEEQGGEAVANPTAPAPQQNLMAQAYLQQLSAFKDANPMRLMMMQQMAMMAFRASLAGGLAFAQQAATTMNPQSDSAPVPLAPRTQPAPPTAAPPPPAAAPAPADQSTTTYSQLTGLLERLKTASQKPPASADSATITTGGSQTNSALTASDLMSKMLAGLTPAQQKQILQPSTSSTTTPAGEQSAADGPSKKKRRKSTESAKPGEEPWPPVLPPGFVPGVSKDMKWGTAAKLILHEKQKPMSAIELAEESWNRKWRMRPVGIPLRESGGRLSHSLETEMIKTPAEKIKVTKWGLVADGTIVWGLKDFLEKGMKPMIPINPVDGISVQDAIVKVLEAKNTPLSCADIFSAFESMDLHVNLPFGRIPTRTIRDAIADDLSAKRDQSIFWAQGTGANTKFGLRVWKGTVLAKKPPTAPGAAKPAEPPAAAPPATSFPPTQQLCVPSGMQMQPPHPQQFTPEVFDRMKLHFVQLIEQNLTAEESAKTRQDAFAAQQHQFLATSLLHMLVSCQMNANTMRGNSSASPTTAPTDSASASAPVPPVGGGGGGGEFPIQKSPTARRALDFDSAVVQDLTTDEQQPLPSGSGSGETSPSAPLVPTPTSASQTPTQTPIGGENALPSLAVFVRGVLTDIPHMKNDQLVALHKRLTEQVNGMIAHLKLRETQQGYPVVDGLLKLLQMAWVGAAQASIASVNAEQSGASSSPTAAAATATAAPIQPPLTAGGGSVTTNGEPSSSSQPPPTATETQTANEVSPMSVDGLLVSPSPPPPPTSTETIPESGGGGEGASAAILSPISTSPQPMQTQQSQQDISLVEVPTRSESPSVALPPPPPPPPPPPAPPAQHLPYGRPLTFKEYVPKLQTFVEPKIPPPHPKPILHPLAPAPPTHKQSFTATHPSLPHPIQQHQQIQIQKQVLAPPAPSPPPPPPPPPSVVVPLLPTPDLDPWPPAQPNVSIEQEIPWTTAVKFLLWQFRRPMTEHEIAQEMWRLGWRSTDCNLSAMHEALAGYEKEHGDMGRIELVGMHPSGSWLWISKEYMPQGLAKQPDGTYDMSQFTHAYLRRHTEFLERVGASAAVATANVAAQQHQPSTTTIPPIAVFDLALSPVGDSAPASAPPPEPLDLNGSPLPTPTPLSGNVNLTLEPSHDAGEKEKDAQKRTREEESSDDDEGSGEGSETEEKKDSETLQDSNSGAIVGRRRLPPPGPMRAVDGPTAAAGARKRTGNKKFSDEEKGAAVSKRGRKRKSGEHNANEAPIPKQQKQAATSQPQSQSQPPAKQHQPHHHPTPKLPLPPPPQPPMAMPIPPPLPPQQQVHQGMLYLPHGGGGGGFPPQPPMPPPGYPYPPHVLAMHRHHIPHPLPLPPPPPAAHFSSHPPPPSPPSHHHLPPPQQQQQISQPPPVNPPPAVSSLVVRLANSQRPPERIELSGSEDTGFLEKTVKVILGIKKDQDIVLRNAFTNNIAVLHPKMVGEFVVYPM